MKLSLSITDRFNIAQFLPKEGSVIEQTIARDVIKKTFVSKAEREKLRFFQMSGELDPVSNTESDFEFDRNELEMLIDGFRALEKDRKINQLTIDLALKLKAAESRLNEPAK